MIAINTSTLQLNCLDSNAYGHLFDHVKKNKQINNKKQKNFIFIAN